MTKETYDSGELKKKSRTSSDLKKMENGNFIIKRNISKGKYLMEQKLVFGNFFHENGNLHQIGKFNNGKQDGEEVFHENEKMKKELEN
jgi:antitoxin component YwqK of YwqJK toxin-antitoxin module